MTDNHSTDTGQISVAELLARNGQKVGSRSGGRRRRGAAGGISVAELTGEIPITRDEATSAAPAEADEPDRTPVIDVPFTEAPPAEASVADVEVPDESVPEVTAVAPAASTVVPPAEATAVVPAAQTVAVSDTESTTVTPRVVDEVDLPAPDDIEDAPADGVKVESPTEIIRPAALPRRARAHLDTVAVAPPRFSDAPEPRLLSGPASDLQGTGADDDDEVTETIGVAGDAPAASDTDADSDSGTKTKSRFRKASVKSAAKKSSAKSGSAEDAGAGAATTARVGDSGSAAGDLSDGTESAEDAAEEAADEQTRTGNVRQWALLVGESVVAIVVGGLLFKGFEMLWDAMPWVAFGLALLVIVGLVAVVRILRRTDDITSQLIALAVGAFVAFGPLLFLLPSG